MILIKLLKRISIQSPFADNPPLKNASLLVVPRESDGCFDLVDLHEVCSGTFLSHIVDEGCMLSKVSLCQVFADHARWLPGPDVVVSAVEKRHDGNCLLQLLVLSEAASETGFDKCVMCEKLQFVRQPNAVVKTTLHGAQV